MPFRNAPNVANATLKHMMLIGALVVIIIILISILYVGSQIGLRARKHRKYPLKIIMMPDKVKIVAFFVVIYMVGELSQKTQSESFDSFEPK